MKDTLYLLNMGFTDTDYPGRTFFCPDCTLLEGLLATNPALRSALNVVYVDFAKPRQPLAELLGEANQSLPSLVLADGSGFINDLSEITALFASKYSIPAKHP